MKKTFSAAVAVVVTLLCAIAFPSTAWATGVARSGNTNLAINATSRGSDVAYDPLHDVYLVVSAHGVLNGRFVLADGTPAGGQFPIQAGTQFASFPRVAFSPQADGGAGAFLVTWNEDASPVQIHARLVSYTRSGAFGGDSVIGFDGYFESGPAVAYSTGSQEFLVAWKGVGANDVVAVRVNNAAQLIAAVPWPHTPDGERDPSIAYDQDDNQFLVVYSGYNNAYGFVAARRVQSGTGAVLDSADVNNDNRITLYQTAGTYITGVTYNSATKAYLATWHAKPANASLGQVVSPNGTLSGSTIVLSTRWTAYDGLGVAYNPSSGTFFLVSHNTTVNLPAEDGGVEIYGTGAPVDNGFVVTSDGATNGNFYPRIAASSDTADWLMSTAMDFKYAMSQRLTGSGGPPPPPPPPPVPDPRMSLENPASGAVSGPFMIAGFAVDLGAAAGTGVDLVHVYAYPNPGSGAPPLFLGAAAYGFARPDVGAAYGNRFTNSGYQLAVSGLLPGVYDIAAFAHSSVTGTFSAERAIRISVPTYISIDTPVSGAGTGTYFTMSGWAIDASAASGTGVDTIHVWGYPNPGSGAPPVFLGVGTYGLARPDVGALYGSRFTNSGYQLTVWGLTPGVTYDIMVYARSTATGTFTNFQGTRVTVTARVAVDAPANGQYVTTSFGVSGWAIDSAARSGSGIDAVHVWAYPTAGGPAVFLGAAAYGSARPDVGGVFGPAFTNSGYGLYVSGLARGTYDIAVYGHSTVTGSFTTVKVVRITIV